MKPKKILSLLLCLLMLASAAFGADFTYGSSEPYSVRELLKKITSLIGTVTLDGDAPLTEGEVYVSADAFVIGSDYVIYPMRVSFTEGDTAASALIRAMSLSGVYGKYEGSEFADFTVSSLNTSCFTVDVEPELEEWLSDIVSYYEPDSFSAGSLGEFDITDMSGWLCFVNGELSPVSMSDYKLVSGDVIELRFSLANGLDLGSDVLSDDIEPYVDAVNRSRLVKAVADGKLDYLRFAEIIKKPSATQEEIDDLLG